MSFQFSAQLAARNFELELSITEGETIAILGPNGAGKSTLLALIAGLLKPDGGSASLDGSVFFEVSAAGTRSWLPPHSRGVSMLAQEALLFPHLSVLENVAFGPRSAGIPKRESRSIAGRWLAEVDAETLASRRPAELSGGQAQRIAVARALASDPRLLLLDEPMAALDIAVAPALRRMLRRVLANRTAVIVTHDILDALLLADRVIVLADGHVIEQGNTREVLERPRTAFTADLAALALVTGSRTTGGLRTDAGVDVAGSTTEPIEVGAAVAIAVRPSRVSVSVEQPELTGHNMLRGIVQDLEPRGDLIRVRCDTLTADVTPGRVADLDLTPGDSVWCAFDAATAELYRI